MSINGEFEVNDAVVAPTAAPVVITFSSNDPTPGLTQTVADGASPTVAETGQFMKDANDVQTKIIADIAAIKVFLDL